LRENTLRCGTIGAKYLRFFCIQPQVKGVNVISKFGKLLLFAAIFVPVSCKTPEGPAESETLDLNIMERNPGTKLYKSPGGISEKCVIIGEMPGGKYSAKDKAKEIEFCNVDFYAQTTGICPKTWSTSPGTIVYEINPALKNQVAFEKEYCRKQQVSAPYLKGKIGTYKQTMNGAQTSGTFSTASLLYYHFSRYFESEVHVPPTVYREMDKNVHLARVSKVGASLAPSGMIGGGWKAMVAAEQSPATYSPIFELFTKDTSKIYGVIVRSKGERYGPEINGIRSNWGDGDSEDFQRTPAYEALKNPAAIDAAIDQTLKGYVANVVPALRARSRFAAVQSDVNLLAASVPGMSRPQIAYWMKEISEIVIFDYIFSQQDRIGNIDYIWKWTYVDPATGKVEDKEVSDSATKDLPRSAMARIKVPADIAAFKPVLLQRTELSDNDAGGRAQYANFAKRTGMLEKIRHISPVTYRKLMALSRDLTARGSIFKYIAGNFPLSDTVQIPQITANVQKAAAILQSICKSGSLKFDLDPEQFLSKGSVAAAAVDCNG
jgi:hypothetical protein